MNMLSFYGGPPGKDFTIAKIFPNKVAMDADLLDEHSKIYVGDYVLISYGDPNTEIFETNAAADGETVYNATVWRKDWDNGYKYTEIVSVVSHYPKLMIGDIKVDLPFGSAPQVTIDSSLTKPKINMRLPASLKSGENNTVEVIHPIDIPTIVPKYEGALFNELSFDVQVPMGVTFMPSVSKEGVISWTNDGGRINPESVSIKGTKGDTGTSFTGIEYTPSAVSGGNNTFKVKYSDGTIGSEVYSIRNGIDVTSVKQNLSTEDDGVNIITFIKSDGTEVGPINVKNGSKGSSGAINSITASIDNNVGTPSVIATISGDKSNADISFDFKNLKGNKGDGGTVAITNIAVDDASVDNGPPICEVISSTTDPQHAKYSLSFHNIVGKQGLRGPRGFYYKPEVSSSGDLSWSNNSDGELTNPVTVNIRGPQGEIGNPLNIVANESFSYTQVAEDSLEAVSNLLTSRGYDPQSGELIAVTYTNAEDNITTYWYFKIEGAWQRIQLSGGIGSIIANEKIEDHTVRTKAYSAEYINALEERIMVLENALTIGKINEIQ